MLKQVGKYQILEKIGVGGFGAVFKGRDPFIKRTVAIKTCQSEEEEFKKRFMREAEYAGNLQHKNITTIFDFGLMDDSTPYIVQEFLTGEDLDRKIKRRDPIDLPERIRILADICDGLGHAHAASIIHRDIKPGNIRVMDDGTVKIMDFGIAKSLVSESNLTQTGITLGTASYLAPEQIRGEPVNIRTDIFSLGVLAYELFAYKKPFTGDNISTVLYRIMNEMPPDLTETLPGIPESLNRLINSMLAKDPAERPETCHEIRNRLMEISASLTARRIPDVANLPLSSQSGSLSVDPSRSYSSRTAASSPSGSLDTGHVLKEHIAATSSPAAPLQEGPKQTGAQTPQQEETSGSALKILIGALSVLIIGGIAIYFAFLRPKAPAPSPEPPQESVPSPAVPAVLPTAVPEPLPTFPLLPPENTPVPAAKAPVQEFGSAFFRSSHYAELTLNGKARGGVPPAGMRLQALAPGHYTAVFSIRDFMSQEKEFEVRAGKTTEVKVEFPGRGKLVVNSSTSTPVPPDVWLDGKRQGILPFSRTVAAGIHKLEVRAEGFEPEVQTIEVPEDGSKTVDVALKKKN